MDEVDPRRGRDVGEFCLWNFRLPWCGRNRRSEAGHLGGLCRSFPICVEDGAPRDCGDQNKTDQRAAEGSPDDGIIEMSGFVVGVWRWGGAGCRASFVGVWFHLD